MRMQNKKIIFSSENRLKTRQLLSFVASRSDESDIGDCTWFILQEEQSLLTQGEYEGTRQVYRVGLGNIPKDISNCDVVHFDIGIGDSIVPEPVETMTTTILDGDTLSWPGPLIAMNSTMKLCNF